MTTSDPREGAGASEAPTLRQLMSAIDGQPELQRTILSGVEVRGVPRSRLNDADVPPPVYSSWDDFLASTTDFERQRWCARKASKANRPRLMSGTPAHKINGADVWKVLHAAEGRCMFCGSLAVENRPSSSDGSPTPWGHVGRRVGSLGHTVSRFHGGSNEPTNLGWCCLWCNTWPEERRPGATDHGGLPENASSGSYALISTTRPVGATAAQPVGGTSRVDPPT